MATEPVIVTKKKGTSPAVIGIIVVVVLLFCCCGFYSLIGNTTTPNSTVNTTPKEVINKEVTVVQNTSTPIKTVTPTPLTSVLKETYIAYLDLYSGFLGNHIGNIANLKDSTKSVYARYTIAKDLEGVYLDCTITTLGLSMGHTIDEYPGSLRTGITDLKSLTKDYCQSEHFLMSGFVDFFNSTTNDELNNNTEIVQIRMLMADEKRNLVYAKITELTNLVNSL